MPNLSISRIQSPVSILPSNARVSALIDHSNGGWNVSLINSVFSQQEADSICSIPLSPFSPPDRMIWAASKQGSFTVRSAYFLEKQRRDQERGESSSKGAARVFWKNLWALEIPAVLKNFMWKVSLNILPTKENLHRKHAAQDPLCPICYQESESEGHIIWSCQSSQAVWQVCSRKIQKLSILENDGMLLLQKLQQQLKESDFIFAMMVARFIWMRRNSFVFEGLFTPPLHLIQQATATLEEFKAATAPGEPLLLVRTP